MFLSLLLITFSSTIITINGLILNDFGVGFTISAIISILSWLILIALITDSFTIVNNKENEKPNINDIFLFNYGRNGSKSIYSKKKEKSHEADCGNCDSSNDSQGKDNTFCDILSLFTPDCDCNCDCNL